MTRPLTSKAIRDVHGGAANVPVWVICPDDPDVVILTTLGEYWSRIYEDASPEWERIFSEGPESQAPRTPE